MTDATLPIAPRHFVLEGHDGAGKSTLHAHLAALLPDRLCPVQPYHDPDPALPLGALVYRIRAEPLSVVRESRHLLWAGASVEAQQQALSRAAPHGAITLSDRSPVTSYVDLTTMDVARFLELHRPYLFPRLLFHLAIDAEHAYERLIGRGQAEASARWLRESHDMRAGRYAEIYAALRRGGVDIVEITVEHGMTPDDLAAEIVPRIAATLDL